MREVNIASVQFRTGKDPEENLRKALRFIDEAATKGADVILFPEFWLTGTPTFGDNTRLYELAEEIPGPTFDTLQKKAKETGIFIIPGTIIEKDGEDLYNTSGIISNKGELIAKLRKDHPEDGDAKAEVHFGIKPGPGEYPVFDTEIGKIAVPIDTDIVAIEVPRIMGLKGVEILFTPMCWGAHVHTCVAMYSKAASSISDAYVVAANGVGTDPMKLGGSGVYWLRDCIGMVPDFTEGLTITTIDLDKVTQRRERAKTVYPYWRRPETYKMLVDPELERKARG
jgi:deaminated glutathione amidase